ncbi:MAG TPA: phosphoadenylyl-sulfate reductase [Alphaproteobacteria bacterium]|nr:phosphoadenylyl-sulfate reductase [Alphaproteobacteria bacterium]HBA41703.1 phosphoadenylyl-sulfate reductase [Alphaproteobacteria bacterium]HBC54414.1 phosphoadenylyl-sulfate reductase [Alphaproteobacteria bacterium]HCO91787.1 phosphoadenylyl-sulfate reductase [Alphaproteobacteria bacterium]
MVEAVSQSTSSRLEQLQADYNELAALDLLRVMTQQEFPGRIAVVSSFGAESAILLHLLAQVDPTVPVLFLNTGKLFGETMRYRDRLQERLGLTDLRAIGPHPADRDKLDPDGVLWSQNPDACCDFRKTVPLSRALEGFDAWITGRKRFQTQERADMAPVEQVKDKFRINPLSNWTQQDLDAYMKDHRLPAHPLVREGYLSIGCMACTSKVAPGEDPRAGRWRGQDKNECGIHLETFNDGGGI